MIIGNYDSLMIHLEKAYILGYTHDAICPLGYLSFNIDHKLYPSNFCRGAMELYNTIDTMKENLENWLATNPKDFNLSIEDIKQMQIDGYTEAYDDEFDYENNLSSYDRYKDSLILLTHATDLQASDFGCYLGFQGNQDRLFYAVGANEKPYYYILQEANYPRGTVANLIMSLPNAHHLENILEQERNSIYRTYTRTTDNPRSFEELEEESLRLQRELMNR